VKTKPITVTLSLAGETSTQARGELLERNPVERLGRAGIALLALWGIAAGCVLIPIAHFILVPSGVIAGLVVAIVRFREDKSLVHLNGLCPRCKVLRLFGNVGRFREGSQVHCSGCGSQLEVRVASPG
jgi:hypothetical protein